MSSYCCAMCVVPDDLKRVKQLTLTFGANMNYQLQEDYEYHQNAKWDHNQQLNKEHHDPFASDEMTDQEIKELIEQAKKDEEIQ